MAPPLILETTFLIDLERELHREEAGAAVRFLQQHEDRRLVVTPTVVGEIASGMDDGDRERWDHFLAPFRVLEIDREVCWRYSRIYRFLRDNGALIGTNDLWIAATAVAHDMPLVTRNQEHFRRVPGLAMRSY